MGQEGRGEEGNERVQRQGSDGHSEGLVQRQRQGSDGLPDGLTLPDVSPQMMPMHFGTVGEHFVQITAKLGDHEVNGGMRYKAWAHYRERVLERLGGWHLIASGPDFATFSISQSVAVAAAAERHAKISKEERRYWGDKSDFCRCLELVLNEMEPRADKTPVPSSYQLFCQDRRREHKEEGHAMPLEVKVLGAMWKGLTEEERKPWVEKADHLKVSGAALGMLRKRSRCLEGGAGQHGDLPAALQQCCTENGLDTVDVLIRLVEGKQPMEVCIFI